MRQPYRLVPDSLSTDTVELLDALLTEARAGRLIGIAFAGMYRRQEYIVNVAGEAHRSPTLTRGMVAALDDQLREMVHG